MKRLLIAAVLGLVPTLATAQEGVPPSPPTGPAQIMNRAAQGRADKDMKAATAAGDKAAGTTGAPAPAPTPATDPHAAAGVDPHAAAGIDPHAGNPHAVLQEPTQPSADPAPELTRGTLEVLVRDPAGRPYANGEIVLGIMASMGGRSERREKTDAEGRFVFHDLAVGSTQAYRVNVSSGGAKFSSNPFRMPDQGGFRVRVPLKTVTRDDKMIFALVGQTVVELRDDRLHITTSVRLANAGDQVYAFPRDGLVVDLPQGFTAFQWDEVMTDQHATEIKDRGFRLKGSLPPGSLQLVWAYDVPREGEGAKLPISMPFRTYTYRVISEAPQGLKLRVNGFPEAERVQDQGRDLLFTQLRRAPPEPPLGPLTVRIEGIPGPGPGRWIALALALLAMGFGLVRALSPGDDAQDRRTVLSARKASLLEAAKALHVELQKGEVGPQFHARRLDEIQTELATVLRDEELLGPAPTTPAR